MFILAAPAVLTGGIAGEASAGEQPDDFDIDCGFDPPVLFPGESLWANTTLTNRMEDTVLVWNLGIQFDWMAAHEHHYDLCATKPAGLQAGEAGLFRAFFAVPPEAPAAGHTYHVCVEYQVNRSGEPRNDTWMSETKTGLRVVDFALELEPAEITVAAGRSAAVNLSVVPGNGFDGTVEMRIAPPAGEGAIGCCLSPWNTTRPGWPLLLFVSTGPACPDRQYSIAIEGTCHGLKRAAWLDLTVVPPPDFVLDIAPARGGLMAGGYRSFMVTVSGHRNLTDNITLEANGLPAGCSARFYPAVIRPGESARMEVSARADAPADPRHEMTVEARSARWTVTSAVMLEVEPRPYTAGLLVPLLLMVLLAVAVTALAARLRGRGAGKESAP